MTNPDKWYRENFSEKYDDRPVRSEDEISKELIKERKDRPYDAMGDDQGKE